MRKRAATEGREKGRGWSVEKEDRPRSGRLAPTPCPDPSSSDDRSPSPAEKRASNVKKQGGKGEKPWFWRRRQPRATGLKKDGVPHAHELQRFAEAVKKVLDKGQSTRYEQVEPTGDIE